MTVRLSELRFACKNYISSALRQSGRSFRAVAVGRFSKFCRHPLESSHDRPCWRRPHRAAHPDPGVSIAAVRILVQNDAGGFQGGYHQGEQSRALLRANQRNKPHHKRFQDRREPRFRRRQIAGGVRSYLPGSGHPGSQASRSFRQFQ